MNGKEKGITRLNNLKGHLVKTEIYVTLHNFKGVFPASPVRENVRPKKLWVKRIEGAEMFASSVLF